MTSAYKPDALQRYLDKEKFKTTKSPYVTGNSVKMNKNASLKKSLIKAFNFPEIEYPSDASARDYYTLGNNFNTNSLRPVPKKVPSSQNKAVEDFKKDLRMKRKLDKISEHYHTSDAASTIITSLSGPESVILTDKEVFPEVQYPLNARETWAPHYWNPPTIAQKQLEYEKPESLIFNPKVSAKSNKSYAPYKKQVKSKVKQFMEDIDKLNEKSHSQKTRYKETLESNSKKEPPGLFKNEFNKPGENLYPFTISVLLIISFNITFFIFSVSNNSNISLVDHEGLPNKTTEVSSFNIHNDSANINISENQNLKDLLIGIHERNDTSPQTGTSQLKTDIPGSTPILHTIQEESNISSPSVYKSVENEDSHTLKEEKDYLIPKVEEEVVQEVELQIPLTMHIPNDSSDLQASTITTSNTGTVKTTATESLEQTYNDTVIISNDEPLNVNIPLPELDTCNETLPDFSNKTMPLSDINKNPSTTIIVVPVDEYVNMMQIPNFNRLSDASIIVLTPTKKDVTAIATSIDTLPINNERNTITNTRSTSDFEMLPNNSMCHVLSDAVTCSNLTTQDYTVNEFTDALSISGDNNNIQNTTTLLCETNNSREIHSEVILPGTSHNTPISLPNDFTNRMPSNIVPDPTSLHRIDDTVINNKSSEILIDEVTKQGVNHCTSFNLAEKSLLSSRDHVDFSLFNFDNVKHNSPNINKLSDIHKANPIRSVNKVFQQKSVTERINVLPDSQLFEEANNTFCEDATLPHSTEQNELLINNERSERNQAMVISKDVQIPTQEHLNDSRNNVAGGKCYECISNANISNTEEENPGLSENNQILSIPLIDDAKSEETLLERKINELTDELTVNSNEVDQTKDIQEASESMTLPHEPQLIITLTASTPIQEDSYSIEQDNFEDTTYLNCPTDNNTSTMENALQQYETNDTTMNIPVSYEKQFIDNFYQAVPILNKNWLPLFRDSDYEERLAPKSNVDCFHSLPSFTDNSTPSNTNYDNDDKSLLDDSKIVDEDDFEQDQNIYLIFNDTIRNPIYTDYMTSFENNSNAVEYQNTIQSETSSAETLSLITDKKNVVHAEENVSLPPVDKHQNEVIENELIVDSSPQYSDNESHESLNEIVTETILNDIMDDVMPHNESTTLLDGSEDATQETYTTGVSSDFIHRLEPDYFTGGDTQLLAISSPSDPPTSENQNVKTNPATILTDTDSFNPLEEYELDSNKSLADYVIENETINEPFDMNSINIDSEYNPLLVDEMLADTYYDDEESPNFTTKWLNYDHKNDYY